MEPFSLTPEQVDRFWSKVDKTPGHGPNGDCWVWQGCRQNDYGHGSFYLRQLDSSAGAHVVAFCIAHNFDYKDWPDDLMICHKCNQPWCVNPKHLKIGTAQHNADDRVAAGNSRPADRSPCARLNWEQVREVRRLWTETKTTTADIASMFNMATSTISHIVTNRIWVDDGYVPPSGRKNKYGDEVIAQVKEMRASGRPLKEIAAATGVSMSQISNILSGRQRKG